MKIKIKVMQMTVVNGSNELFTIEGELKVKQPSKLHPTAKAVSDHDIAAALFAIEFAANKNEQFPLRVHIEQLD